MRRNYFRRQAGKGLHSLGYPENLPEKIGKGGEKGGSGKGSPSGLKPKGEKAEGMPIFVGFN